MHSLNSRSFEDRDRRRCPGACATRSPTSDVRRIVYLSGLVPDVPVEDLSPHISSRLEVEEVLEEAASEQCSVLSLRAGVVLGAGSTSFEVIRQLATLLLVQPVPSWLEHKVQPIAVSDVLRAMVEAFADDHLTGAVDIGGPNVLPYARLLAESARAAGLLRVRVPDLPVPRRWSASAPPRCAPPRSGPSTALVESLRHDMVCRPGDTWVPPDGGPLLGVREAMARALGPVGQHARRRRSRATPTGPGCAPRSSTSCTRRRPCVPVPASPSVGCGLSCRSSEVPRWLRSERQRASRNHVRCYLRLTSSSDGAFRSVRHLVTRATSEESPWPLLTLTTQLDCADS